MAFLLPFTAITGNALFKRCQGWQADAAVGDYKTGDVRIRNDAAMSEEDQDQ